MTHENPQHPGDPGTVRGDRDRVGWQLGAGGDVAEPPQRCVDLRLMDLEDTDDRELIEVIRDDGAASPERARRILTERHQPLVIGQSAKLHRGRGPDHEDLVSVAQHGLQKAITDYDLGHGAPFAAYARAKVRGEMLRWLRDDQYSVLVPQAPHERLMHVHRAASQLETELHRQPDIEELAATLDCSVAEIFAVWAADSAERVRTNRLDDRLGGAASLDPAGPGSRRGLRGPRRA